MSFIDWTEQMSIHVPEMDAQHMQLIQLLNDLHNAMEEGKEWDVVATILIRLINYTNSHLEAEERFMESIDYKFAVSHKISHDNLANEVIELQAEYSAGNPNVSYRLLNLLSGWLVNHIDKEDRKYGEYYLRRVAEGLGGTSSINKDVASVL